MRAAPASAERVFEYRGGAIIVRAAESAMLDWLEELVAPWFEVRPTPSGSPLAVVEVEVDAARFERVTRAGRPTGDVVACFTMDGGEKRVPTVRLEAPDGELAVDADAGMALGVCADEGVRTVVVLAARERPAARLALLRVVRELASAHALGRGELPIHAAAVTADDGVTLFTGRKGAGKSTLLVHALMRAGTRYVANDRVFVRADEGAPVVRGMPTIVTLREGTLALSATLRDEVTSGAWHYTSTVAEARADRAARTVAAASGARWPPGLSPAQLCAILAVGGAAGGPLARIVFPEVRTTMNGASFSLRTLSPSEASTRLLDDGLVAGGRSATYLSGAAAPTRAALAGAVRALTATVSCVECVLGPEAYATPALWEALAQAARATAARSPAAVRAGV